MLSISVPLRYREFAIRLRTMCLCGLMVSGLLHLENADGNDQALMLKIVESERLERLGEFREAAKLRAEFWKNVRGRGEQWQVIQAEKEIECLEKIAGLGEAEQLQVLLAMRTLELVEAKLQTGDFLAVGEINSQVVSAVKSLLGDDNRIYERAMLQNTDIQTRLRGAEVMLRSWEQCVARAGELYGTEHPLTLSVADRCAAAELDAKKYSEALERMTAVATARAKIFGRDSLPYGQSQQNISVVYMRMGELPKAKEHSERAVGIYRRLFEKMPHAHYVQALENKLSICRALELKDTEAEVRTELLGSYLRISPNYNRVRDLAQEHRNWLDANGQSESAQEIGRVFHGSK